jgi:dihydroorotate dehydrogenase (fumarate)
MILDTNYLKITLRSPLVVSASPLSERVDDIKRMEEAGAGAVVLYSLFEEQIRIESQMRDYFQQYPSATAEDAEALFPASRQFRISLDGYLEHIRAAKAAVSIPVIASINCKSLGSWTDFAVRIEQSGADALELNIYFFPANSDQTTEQIETAYLTIVKIIKSAVSIPVAVKLTPYFTNMARMARRLDDVEADALVLFNRFYQPDFDPKTLKITSSVPEGSRADARLPLHWIAALCGTIKADLAATGGIYTAEDVVKMLMVGAKVTMLASALHKDGIDHLRVLDRDLRAWLDENDYESITSLQGILRQFRSKSSSAFERDAYIKTITGADFEI